MSNNHKNDKEKADDILDLEEIKTTEACSEKASDQNKVPQASSGQKKEDKKEADPAPLDQTEVLENQVEEEIEELKSKMQGLNDKYLRLMAEFDNFKRRTAREYEKMVEYAGEKLILEIIEVRENLERALKTGEILGPEAQAFVAGMKLIFDKLETILSRQGLEVFCDCGEKFDPELHDALLKAPHEKIKEEHVAQVCEKGYKLKGRVIKHAKVIVSSGAPEFDLETEEKEKKKPDQK
jgi:molecular chaperone GrpE